ncbi:MAG: FkbM family methyltransferase [Candidatus Bathyarchaeota archaeon]|nr:FkbM family methyltransferase [Candidatus Bathyarchaeota archaeon]
MHAPFHRTLRQAREKGLAKTASMMLAISLQQCNDHFRHLRAFPEKSIIEVNNSKMFVLPRQGAIHQELYEFRKREPICTDLLMNSLILKEGDTVLDIGANIGYYVLVESQLVGKSGKVYAVEPVSSNFRLLERNVQLNNLSNVSMFRRAFGGRYEESEIFVCDKSNLCAMKADAVGGKILGKERIIVETVDNFFKDKAPPNLIRMDVEGYEYEIFKGMTKTLKGNPRILVELHYGRPFLEPERVDEIFSLLAKNDFHVRFAVFENKVEENRVVQSLLKRAGYKLPIVASNLSIWEFKELLEENPMSPNVLFEKPEFN